MTADERAEFIALAKALTLPLSGIKRWRRALWPLAAEGVAIVVAIDEQGHEAACDARGVCVACGSLRRHRCSCPVRLLRTWLSGLGLTAADLHTPKQPLREGNR